MNLLARLFASKPDPRESLRPLWQALVAEARRPLWYREGGVADTVSGRFDMVSSVVAIALLRLEHNPELRPASTFLTELFAADMDGQLREFGVGDVIVGKRMAKLMGAFNGRLAAYREGLAGDANALNEAVLRNVTFQSEADPTVVSEGLRNFFDRLERTEDEELVAGRLAA